MNKTNIEWVKNPYGTQGYTWNPITGCLNHDNGLCKGGGFPCYAYRLANGRLKDRYTNNANGISQYERDGEYVCLYASDEKLNDPFYPRFWPERLEWLRHRNSVNTNYSRMGIFVCDMSDLFGVGVPEAWTREVLDAIAQNNVYPKDRFYLLTKQPQNLIKFSPFPDNCWVGVTVTTNGMMTLALQYLSMIKAKVKYISFEPLLGMIGLNDHMPMKGIVDWLIIGAQTKPYKPPRIEWVREIVKTADKVNIPVFLKNNLKPLLPEEAPYYDVIDEDPMLSLRLRQEMPIIK